MKKKILSAMAAVCIVCTMFLFAGRVGISPKSYESGDGFRNVELHNKNPYAIFGSDAVVLMTEAERKSDHVLEIVNDNPNDPVSRMELDMRTGIAKLFDKEENLSDERLLDAKEKARWLTQDRFAEKYYSMSPYSYAVGNPIKYIDINGDSINIAWIQQIDQILGTNYTQTLTSDLTAQTGLTYSISSNGILTYARDNSGNAIISTDANGKQLGSETARNHMMNAIGHVDMVTVIGGVSTSAKAGTNLIGFNTTQMDRLINGAVGVDNRTMGWGMTFMHELYHTQVGGGLSDSPYGAGNPGPVATNMNIIRSELNAQGGNYGQRQTYLAYPSRGHAIIPFNFMSNSILSNGGSVYPTSPGSVIQHQYIKYPH